MRKEVAMPLRRGGPLMARDCGDDCMPTTSVNCLEMRKRERKREKRERELIKTTTEDWSRDNKQSTCQSQPNIY